MKLVLRCPVGDKNHTLFVNELAGDEKFKTGTQCFFDCIDSERWEANRMIKEACAEVGFKNIFNQCTWPGTTGWEFWTDDHDVILNVVIKVIEKLNLDVEIV